LIVLASSITITAIPTEFYVVVFGRFFAGIAHGLTYVTIASHLGENCCKSLRGLHATFNFFCVSCGIIISIMVGKACADARTDIDYPMRIAGGVSCFISIIAIIMTYKHSRESIVDLIRRGREFEALRVLQHLRGENFETTTMRDDFDDLKAMISEDKVMSASIFRERNVWPLIIVTMLKFSFVLSFNSSLNAIRLDTPVIVQNDFEYLWIFFPRIIIGILIAFSIESGRRIHFLTSSIMTLACLIAIGTLRLLLTPSSTIETILFLLYEISGAIGLGAAVHIYDSEAFRSVKKVKSIAFSSIIEQVLQIIFIILSLYVKGIQFYAEIFLLSSAVLLVLISLFMFCYLPETSHISIRSARNMFIKT
jgi:Sugar (and other) transporter